MAKTTAHAPDPVTPEQAKAIAIESSVYFYPLVTMDVTRRLMTNLPAGTKPGMGPATMFHHMRATNCSYLRNVLLRH